jgi:hypothetical protein
MTFEPACGIQQERKIHEINHGYESAEAEPKRVKRKRRKTGIDGQGKGRKGV